MNNSLLIVICVLTITALHARPAYSFENGGLNWNAMIIASSISACDGIIGETEVSELDTASVMVHLAFITARIEKQYLRQNLTVHTPSEMITSYKELWDGWLNAKGTSLEKEGVELIAYRRADYPCEAFLIMIWKERECYYKVKSFSPEDYGWFGDFGLDPLGPFDQKRFWFLAVQIWLTTIRRWGPSRSFKEILCASVVRIDCI